MGMYTELVLKCETKEDIPIEVRDILMYMFGERDEEPHVTPDHPFFSCPRWTMVGKCSSFYHHPQAVSHVYSPDSRESMYIFSRSDLKDYDDEIDKFITWVAPYLQTYGRTCIGWKWYEEDDEPTLIFIGEDNDIFKD